MLKTNKTQNIPCLSEMVGKMVGAINYTLLYSCEFVQYVAYTTWQAGVSLPYGRCGGSIMPHCGNRTAKGG